MRRYVAQWAAAAALVMGGCGTAAARPEAIPCGGLVDVSDSASFVRYSIGKDQYWDVTLALLQNPCDHSVDVVGVELGAAIGMAGQGASVAPRPEQVFAAAAATPVALPQLEGFRVPAGSTVQVVGRFAVIGEEPVHVPPATLAYRDAQRPGSLTLTLSPKVSLCRCGPPR